MEKQGNTVDYWPIEGKGLAGYAKAIFKLRKFLRANSYDVVHGHYLWSVMVAAFQSRKHTRVGSFIGSDLNIPYMRFIARYFVAPILDRVIVVNSQMVKYLRRSNRISVIPYGVDPDVFSNEISTNADGLKFLKAGSANILFGSRFDRYEKNHPLASAACAIAKKAEPINLIELKGMTRNDIVGILNNADLLLLTSLWEGSPQVIKEAMACNCPVVTTDVGDVRWLLQGVDNSYICGFDAAEIATRIVDVLDRGGRSNGRARIFELGLDLPSIASRVLSLYNEATK
jgi:glycosyltransferase involved in cell wall biosynthesis